MSTVFDIAAFMTGFAACWFAKDKITQLVTGTEAFIKALEAKASALKAAL
jgi:hypothetical protein